MQTHYNVLKYRTDLYFHDYNLAIEVDKNGHSNRDFDHNLVLNFLELILKNKTLIFLELSMKYLDTSSNQLKKL